MFIFSFKLIAERGLRTTITNRNSHIFGVNCRLLLLFNLSWFEELGRIPGASLSSPMTTHVGAWSEGCTLQERALQASLDWNPTALGLGLAWGQKWFQSFKHQRESTFLSGPVRGAKIC